METLQELLRKLSILVEGFISDMLTKSSYLQAPTIVEDSNDETTDEDKWET